MLHVMFNSAAIARSAVCGLFGLAIAIAVTSSTHAASSGDECATGTKSKVPNCVTKAGHRQDVRPQRKVFFDVTCPKSAPYFWNWTADVTAGTFVTLQEVEKWKSDGRARGGRFVAHRQVNTAGQARVYLGCSTAPPIVRARLNHVGILPPANH